jgi:large subunit ribosomal protein L18
MNKHHARKRRGLKTKAIIKQSNRPRLTVHRSGVHIYSQIIVRGDQGDQVVVSASTLDKELRADLTGNKCDQANQVGQLLAKRALEKKLHDVAFDRAGYKYHGRVKALATGARDAGLNF